MPGNVYKGCLSYKDRDDSLFFIFLNGVKHSYSHLSLQEESSIIIIMKVKISFLYLIKTLSVFYAIQPTMKRAEKLLLLSL